MKTEHHTLAHTDARHLFAYCLNDTRAFMTQYGRQAKGPMAVAVHQIGMTYPHSVQAHAHLIRTGRFQFDLPQDERTLGLFHHGRHGL